MTELSNSNPAGDQAEGGSDAADMKRKFRQALAKKHAHGGTDVSDTSERGKVAGARGAKTSGTQQMFRRKSG